MANHCIDVICGGCGRVYCLRGCGTDFKEDKEFLKKWLDAVPKEKRFVFTKDDCCEGHDVYSFSCGDVRDAVSNESK
jgi:hypothetical protein